MNFISYLGIPFVKGGRDPKTGLDCWGLVVAFYRAEFGLVLSNHAAPLGTITKRLETRDEELGSGQWHEITDPATGDGVGLGTSAGLSHVGIYVERDGEPCLLHSQTRCSVIQPLSMLKANGFPQVRFYRHDKRLTLH
jgi:cell wall-associated NlpC family hydrolase